ncbi:hypothetical protein EW146_g2433 [Bondarzewia mesenterica]|uniref:NADP-dependent oxidoreductase domain-containing protein n=1 Tax=Bondarzewia mesenterica TaxID=1095465 RepID=A0A4S4M0N0_9AGAM|nr:hypothetical protein EW146_g2433 [Bondarzewia mesenterica]
MAVYAGALASGRLRHFTICLEDYEERLPISRHALFCAGHRRCTFPSDHENSLKKFQTDHIDLHYIHCAEPIVRIEKTIAAMAELINRGLLTGSFHNVVDVSDCHYTPASIWTTSPRSSSSPTSSLCLARGTMLRPASAPLPISTPFLLSAVTPRATHHQSHGTFSLPTHDSSPSPPPPSPVSWPSSADQARAKDLEQEVLLLNKRVDVLEWNTREDHQQIQKLQDELNNKEVNLSAAERQVSAKETALEKAEGGE